MTEQIAYGLPLDVLEKLRSVFRKHVEVERVLLYGSRALGTQRIASDIDLTILGDSANLSILMQIENEIDDLMLPYKVDLSLYNHIDNPNLKDHIHRVGVDFL